MFTDDENWELDNDGKYSLHYFGAVMNLTHLFVKDIWKYAAYS